VGGVFSTAGTLTGSIGDTLAVLSFDKDFQRRRRETVDGVGDGLLKGGVGFARSVYAPAKSTSSSDLYFRHSSLYDGVSGVFLDPLQGAQEDGVKGG